MSDAPLVYCRPDECSYCIALARNLETALAELAALKEREPSEVESECARYRHLYEAESRIRKAQDKELAALRQAGQEDHTPECEVVKLRDALAALKTALRLAAGELSTYGDHTTQHPQEVYDDLVKAARAEEGGES